MIPGEACAVRTRPKRRLPRPPHLRRRPRPAAAPTDGVPRGASAGGSFVVLPEQLAVRPVDEMKPGTCLAEHGLIGAIGIPRRPVFVQRVLHVQSGPRTFEDKMFHAAALSGMA